MPPPPLPFTVVITSRDEAKTLGRALDTLLHQTGAVPDEILVVCPDGPSAEVVTRYAAHYPQIRLVRDHGVGKPAALNLALPQASHDVLVLTDGDVYVDTDALRPLVEPLRDPSIGAVSGRPVSLNDRGTLLGYWSHVLVEAGAHRLRLRRTAQGQPIECSGYLYALRRRLVDHVPEEVLSDDGYISMQVWSQGYRIGYAPAARVYVRFPTTFQDWLRQKVRGVAGYYQPYLKDRPVMRSFWNEAVFGLWNTLAFARTPRELVWTLLLLAARVYVWFRGWLDVRLRPKPFQQLWERVESTK